MSLVSKVDIFNMALGHIGISNLIELESETTPEAKQIRLWYPTTRRTILQAYPWSFARQRAYLAEHSEDPPEGVWAYRYVYPSECLKARFIENPAGPQADPVPFELEMSSNGEEKTLLTDLEDAKLVYTFDQAAISTYSESFVMALSALLASNICQGLTVKREFRSDALALYQGLLTVAASQDANEGQSSPPRDADAITARY